jgi:hypothetical protein
MRILVRVTLGVVSAVLGTLLLLGLGAGTASAAPHPAPAAVVSVHPAATPAPPTTTSPTDYNKGQQQADSNLARRKLVIGIICVVLLGIVYIGHRAKGRHILRLKNLQNAKG